MNFNQLITEIEKVDPEVYDRLDSRRAAMRTFTNVGSKIALTAAPFLLGGMFKKAYAGDKKFSSITDVLNFALTLEYLEASFYYNANNTSNLLPNADVKKTFDIIGKHEIEHVVFLNIAIKAAGGTPVSEPKFDYTAGGTFPTVFSDYDTFLAVSQTFEDTGVRAYKGQAKNLMSNNIVLTAALRIHSVEARHASKIRELRSEKYNDETIRPWITGHSTSGIGAAVQASYAGEQITNQLGVEIHDINGYNISYDDATECFDEPLSMDQVLAIVSPFIVQ